jgi:thioredoxin 1
MRRRTVRSDAQPPAPPSIDTPPESTSAAWRYFTIAAAGKRAQGSTFSTIITVSLPAGRAFGAEGFRQMSDIKTLSDASFEQDVLKSPTPVLVDYWAEWCGPCRAIAPIVAEVAAEYQGRLSVAKLNVDDNQLTPAKYGIRGIPTLMLFKNGTVAGTRVGQLSKPQLIAFIDSNL